MEILYLLIPIAVVVMAVAIGALVWAVRSGQFDDLEGPAHRILMDDDDPRIPRRREEAESSRKPEQDKDKPT
ncbi:cbb3-type cytochrome oxidase assembly protein CcoS [Thiohalophilus thiocyanatoxydans]|uniref:Cbb3-type cytochrome oxidase maturation protein n=1 Tax=Thiohalophilus thiocyanatoxydans TaxID=381308 RepID=A0A4R8IST1_9GAMM|nr:cbb3-type cytochrome oxidase assembly protein CcoS [Thiohalophilus thiocyanatoxydans]TDY04102.1 cbb3-type cytochrome oxidase maturation protein [Thiohalophilus thiocyanatoxydans]